MKNLRDLDSFGEVAAEDDTVLLDYFLTTDSVSEIERNKVFLVLGRKGSGKTALVRHFTEGEKKNQSRALSLRNYPWNVHADRKDRGASDVESYVASWKYLISVEIAAWALTSSQNKFHDEQKVLENFLVKNYGMKQPKLADIIRPKSLEVSGFSFAPSIFGNQIGGISLDRSSGDRSLGVELDALSNALLSSAYKILLDCNSPQLYLHFDELDHGLDTLDYKRSSMIVGLIIAIRDLRRAFIQESVKISVALYLRTDIWDELSFSDKNKITQTQALILEWDNDSLQSLINNRLRAKIGSDANWGSVIDSQLMRGSQPKWNHIVARTLKRPRDVIKFLNIALKTAKKRADSPLQFTNKDIVTSRNDYSAYLKKELDDEIEPHWKYWEEALKTCSAIATEKFDKQTFLSEHSKRQSAGNQIDGENALQLLHRFSVIGYETRSGYGGSGWAFQYEDPDKGWDALVKRFKIHPGLKEYAKIREERQIEPT